MVGRDMLKGAEIKSQLKQFEAVNAAVMNFKMKYNSLPGDMPASAATQFGFMSRAGTQGFGDGNGIIEGGSAVSSSFYGWNIATGEAMLFWDDLDLSLMFTSGLNLSPYGVVSPKLASPIGKMTNTNLAVWSCMYTGGTCTGPGQMGVSYLVLCDVSATRTTCNPGLTPNVAYQLDSKIDDGTPMKGNIRAFGPVVWTGNSPDWSAYASPDTSASCFNHVTNAYSLLSAPDNINCSFSINNRW